ncbi:MAG: nucleoside 2-deoxyribosyltransferase, partial [Methanothrix sp.]|nr:nucleoside 2-deoxyribosyltransferase [Methanothrix sp.]
QGGMVPGQSGERLCERSATASRGGLIEEVNMGNGVNGSMVHKIYLSGPLFSRGEIAWGERVKRFLEDRLDGVLILWPHELISCQATAEQIFQANLQALNECDIMVAMLDGSQVDDGTAWEIGYFFMQGKKIMGLRTDFRRGGETDNSRVNLMIECSCQAVASGLEELGANLLRLLD